jgi:hypothetical protein
MPAKTLLISSPKSGGKIHGIAKLAYTTLFMDDKTHIEAFR